MNFRFVILRLVLFLSLLTILSGCIFNAKDPSQDVPQIILAEGSSQPEFEQAISPFVVELPRDHGSHDSFQTEWWYYTGNLETEAGRHFGFQFTIFRRGLQPGPSESTSDFGTTQIYFAHLALTDVASGEHLSYERFSRGAAGLAGAEADPFRVWVEDWSVEGLVQDGSQVRLNARQNGLSLALELTAQKPIVKHGETGLSAKSEEPGNASYYLSYTRMTAIGQIETGGDRYEVAGSSWFDHEWSTSALGSDDVGWDWFGLQLDDGRELMVYQIRRQDGTIESISGGTLIALDGSATNLDVSDIILEATGEWKSPTSETAYPSGWRLAIPLAGVELEVKPYLADQEMKVSFLYWEGAVSIQGISLGEPVSGWGYVELTGYSESMAGVF